MRTRYLPSKDSTASMAISFTTISASFLPFKSYLRPMYLTQQTQSSMQHIDVYHSPPSPPHSCRSSHTCAQCTWRSKDSPVCSISMSTIHHQLRLILAVQGIIGFSTLCLTIWRCWRRVCWKNCMKKGSVVAVLLRLRKALYIYSALLDVQNPRGVRHKLSLRAYKQF